MNTDLTIEDLCYDNCKKFIPDVTIGKIIKVYDGDTVTIGTIFNDQPYRFNVRLRNIDASEIRNKDKKDKEKAIIARDVLSDKIMNKIVTLENIAYDKYGRILADVIYNDENISEWLLSGGYVEKY